MAASSRPRQAFALALLAVIAGRVNMASCHDFLEALYAYVADELPHARREALTGHLASCHACQAELSCYQQVIQLARQLPGVPPPPHLLDRFRELTKKASHPHPPKPG